MLDWLFQQSEPERAFDSNWLNPLNVDKKEIRLLRVFPAFRHSAPIVCDIRGCTLDVASSHAYRALSYFWGDPEAEKRPITLDGSTLMVQPNLESALRHLRSKVFPLIIWVDAICINQSDLKERAQVVTFMREIYLGATIVNVWLGPASDESDRAMDFVAAAWAELERNGGQNSAEFFQWYIGQTSPANSTSPWTALLALMKRHWWSRVWVIQEVSNRLALKKSVFISCGFRWMHYNPFVQTFVALRQCFYQSINLDDEDFMDFDRIVQITSDLEMGPPAPGFGPSQLTSLLDLVSVYRFYKATDPRDKIYALQGLIHDQNDKDLLKFKPEYDSRLNPKQKLYIEFAMHFIECGRLGDILCACTAEHELPHLPSWTPDWTTPMQAPLSLSLKSIDMEPDHHFTSSASSKQAVELPVIDNVLQIQSVVLNRVENLTDQFTKENMTSFFKHGGNQLHGTLLWEAYSLLLGCDKYSATPLTANTDTDMVEYARSLNGKYVAGGDLSAAWFRTLFILNPSVSLDESVQSHDNVTRFTRSMKSPKTSQEWMLRTGFCRNRRFFVSNDGYMGFVPKETEIGDFVCVFLGVNVPFVIRRKGRRYSLIGECFVYGYMQGEAMRKVNEGTLEISTIALA
jgi:Heterokaryon incompatibility protein (HET)